MSGFQDRQNNIELTLSDLMQRVEVLESRGNLTKKRLKFSFLRPPVYRYAPRRGMSALSSDPIRSIDNVPLLEPSGGCSRSSEFLRKFTLVSGALLSRPIQYPNSKTRL